MPFPTTKVIHPRWSAHHQPVAEGGMTCRLHISVPGAGPSTFDWTTGETTSPDPDVLYPLPGQPGIGRVQADFRAQDTEQGEQSTSVRRYLVAIPADAPAIPYAAVVTIDACDNDAQLVGRRFFVHDVTVASERFERDLICLETATPGTPE